MRQPREPTPGFWEFVAGMLVLMAGGAVVAILSAWVLGAGWSPL